MRQLDLAPPADAIWPEYVRREVKPIRLILIDDHPVVREGICALLGLESDMTVVGDAGDLENGIDLVFGNCEGAFTDHPHFAPSAGWRVVAPASNGRSLAKAGFDVMATANNHILDAGHGGLIDTLNLLRSQGIKTVGAGTNLAEARAAAIVERGGVRVGFLGFASVYQAGYEARTSTPGLSAMRVHSHYFIPEWDAYGKVEPGVVPAVRKVVGVLHGGDGHDSPGTLDLIEPDVRYSDVPDLAAILVLLDRLKALLERNIRVDAVQVVEGDAVGAQRPEAVLDLRSQHIRAAVLNAALRGHDGVSRNPRESLTDRFFALAAGV